MTYWVAGAAIVGALVSSQGAKSAANTQANAAGNAQQISQNEFNTITAQEQPFVQSGYGAMNQLNYLLGIGPQSGTNYGGGGYAPLVGGSGAAPAPSGGNFFNSGSGALLNPATVSSKLGGAGKILDPAYGVFGNLFGGGQSSNKRNFNAFDQAFPGTTVTKDGNYQLPAQFGNKVVTQKQLDDLTGTWYGGAFAPDGDQQGWQQKFKGVMDDLGIQAPTTASSAAGSGWTMSPDGTMHQQLQTGTGGGAAGQPVGSTAGGYGSLLKPFTADNFRELSPAYNFQLEQGMQGTLNGEAAGAGALSGAAQKDLMSFNQNLANTSFNNAFNQYQTQQGNIYSRLAGIAQLGQSAAANTGQQGTALAGQAAQSATNIGTAQAAGQIGQANAWSGALSSALPWLAAGSSGNWSWGGSPQQKAGP